MRDKFDSTPGPLMILIVVFIVVAIGLPMITRILEDTSPRPTRAPGKPLILLANVSQAVKVAKELGDLEGKLSVQQVGEAVGIHALTKALLEGDPPVGFVDALSGSEQSLPLSEIEEILPEEEFSKIVILFEGDRPRLYLGKPVDGQATILLVDYQQNPEDSIMSLLATPTPLPTPTATPTPAPTATPIPSGRWLTKEACRLANFCWSDLQKLGERRCFSPSDYEEGYGSECVDTPTGRRRFVPR